MFKNERERERKREEKRERKERKDQRERFFFPFFIAGKKSLLKKRKGKPYFFFGGGGTFSFFFFFFLSIISVFFSYTFSALCTNLRAFVFITRNKRDEKRPDERATRETRDETRRWWSFCPAAVVALFRPLFYHHHQ